MTIVMGKQPGETEEQYRQRVRAAQREIWGDAMDRFYDLPDEPEQPTKKPKKKPLPRIAKRPAPKRF